MLADAGLAAGAAVRRSLTGTVLVGATIIIIEELSTRSPPPWPPPFCLGY